MDRHVNNGRSLALELLNNNINWKSFAVDLRGVSTPLTRDFFKDFVQTIVEEAPILKEDISNTIWIYKSHSMENQIYEWLESILIADLN